MTGAEFRAWRHRVNLSIARAASALSAGTSSLKRWGRDGAPQHIAERCAEIEAGTVAAPRLPGRVTRIRPAYAVPAASLAVATADGGPGRKLILVDAGRRGTRRLIDVYTSGAVPLVVRVVVDDDDQAAAEAAALTHQVTT